jgi:hypothetical protein
MYRIFISGDSDEARFKPGIFLQPALGEYLRRAASVPAMLYETWRELLMAPFGGPRPT